MKLASTSRVKPGTTLAQSIYNDNGVVLIARGIEITETMIVRLLEQGVTYIYIEDEHTKDVHVESIIPDKLRSRASKTIKEAFVDISKNGLTDKTSFLLDEKQGELSEISGDLLDNIITNGKSISLLADIYISDNYIFHHSINVAIYSLSIGLKLNMPIQKLKELAIGAMLHDVGKVFIDQKVLHKPGSLTDEEFAIMKTHAELGYDFLRKQNEFSSIIAHCAYQHHERLDGSGYPRGLKGDEIITAAKIIGIADVFDAVTSNRVYRKALLPHEGLEIIYAGAVDLFDIKMVEAFRESIVVYPNGLSIRLSDHREAVVIRQNKHLCDRPIVRVIVEDGVQVSIPYEVDLGLEMNLTIKDVLKN